MTHKTTPFSRAKYKFQLKKYFMDLVRRVKKKIF